MQNARYTQFQKQEKTVVRLHLSALHLRRRNLETEFFINIFIKQKSCPAILNTVVLLISSKVTRDHSTFTAPYCALPHLLWRPVQLVVTLIFPTEMAFH